MNEDVHNIDDLFKEGIEGYEEAVPPSMWESVSNDLDKQQASYYRNKYYRLKHVFLLLLLLCFLRGSYLVYDGLKEKPGTPKPENTETEQVTKLNALPKEKKKPDNFIFNLNSKSTQEKMDAEVQNDRTQNATSFLTNSPTSPKLKESEVTDLKLKRSKENPSLVFTSNLQATHSKQFSVNPMGLLKKKGKQKNSLYADTGFLSRTPLSSSPSLKILPLIDKYSNTPFQFQILNANKKVILPATVMSSPAKSKSKSVNSLSLTAFMAPNISFGRLEDDDHLAGPGRNRQNAHREEQENFSFSSGVLLNYELTRSLSLQSGISITSTSTSVAPKTVYAKADNNGHTRYELNCSSGYAYLSPKAGTQPLVGDSAQTSSTTSKLTYVNIPASISYRISMKRFSISPVIGAGLNILSGSKTKTSISNAAGSESATTSISGLKPSYVDGHVGLGIDYGLNKKLSIGIRPNARIALTPINRETPVRSYQNFLSIEAGVRIKW